jgi:hypothetical protein
MPVTELEDDEEDWYDDDSDDPDDESVPCPECGNDVYVITGKCPSCGYWLTDADHRAAGSSDSKPFWLRATAIVVLLAMLASIMIGLAAGVF